MRDLLTVVRDWWTIKTAKNPDPDLEERIRCERVRLQDQVNLLRLAQSEMSRVSGRERIKNRFSVMDSLINDVVRR